MTISDKIRVYELSRDLNLDNKDIIDAAQKLSISVKSHSSSISLADAKKIKTLINKKNPSEKIISVNKPNLKTESDTPKNKNTSSLTQESKKDQVTKEILNQKPLLIRPVTKPNIPISNTSKKIDNKFESSKNPKIVSKNHSQVVKRVDDKNNISMKGQIKKGQETNFINRSSEAKSLPRPSTPSIKSPSRPPIQLIDKPKNLINKNNNQNFKAKNNSFYQQTQPPNKLNQNPSKNNPNIRKNTPELVGAPIRRTDSKTNSTNQNFKNRQNTTVGSPPNKPARHNPNKTSTSVGDSYKQGSPNRTGGSYKKGTSNRPPGQNRQGISSNRQGAPNRAG